MADARFPPTPGLPDVLAAMLFTPAQEPHIGPYRPSLLPMTNRQEATVIAALTLWRCLLEGKVDLVGTGCSIPDVAAVASDMGLHEPLSSVEVDQLLATVFRVEV